MATNNGTRDDTPPDKRPRGGYSAPPPDETPRKDATADPKQEYVASSGYGAGLRDYLRALPVYVDDLTREVDLQVYERMRWDECVAGSLDALVYQALADDIDFRPAVDDEDSQYYQDAKTQADTINRVMADMERPLIEWAYEMVSDAIGGGNRVAEKVVRQEEGGPYSGLWVWDRLKVKPRRHLSFAMDSFNNLRGILTAIPGVDMALDGSIPLDPKETPNLLPREKFSVLSWNSHNDDPRGRPLLRRVYVPWWEKIQVAGEWLKHLARFGSPSLVGTTAPNSDFVPPQDDLGNPLSGTAPGPEQALLNGLERLQNGGCLVLPHGATVTALQVTQSGSAFLTKIDQCDRAITRGVMLAIRAVMESKFGSKADSQTAQDVTGLVVRYIKNWAARTITRDLVKPLVVWNRGADAARVICPYASLTPVEHQDWSQKATAVAALKTSGFLKPSQEPALAEEMGLPPATEPVQEPQPQQPQQPGGNGAQGQETQTVSSPSSAPFAGDDSDGEWITIGGHPGPRGQHMGGTPVLVKDGRIVKGPSALAGKQIADLQHSGGQGHEQRTGGGNTAGTTEGHRSDVARTSEGPTPAPADRSGASGAESTGPKPAARVPASREEVNKRLSRFQQVFQAKGQHEVAGWLGQLREHVNTVGTEEALKALGDEAHGSGEKVQYGGWADVGEFTEKYLDRNGISLIQGASFDPERRVVSAVAPSTDEGGVPLRGQAGDIYPTLQGLRDKLHEAQHLPGLEKSEDLSKLMGGEMGARVLQFSPEVVAKLDETYGKGQWIVKSYGDEAFSSYGIFFPQRVQQIQQDSRNTIWAAGENLARHGFLLARDQNNRVAGLIHESGDTYPFGTPEYENTIHGDARQWADRAAAAAADEHGAAIPEGRFMGQPAFPVVGVSNEERAAGVIFKRGQEGRVHITTRDGKASIVPHATWLKKEPLPVVFESDDTRAMAQAAVDAINALPESERQGQLYAPDVVKTAQGYRAVEANPANEAGASGYLQDNPLVMDAYVSHLTGREPAHVQFIRKLLTQKEGRVAGARFASEDPFDFGDVSFGGLSREEIAEILIDAALDARDDAEFAAEFYDPNQLRDERGRWTTGGGSGGTALPHAERQAQRETAKETVRQYMAGKGSPSLQEASELARALATLTVAQMHEVKREHGLKASAKDKAGLVKKLAERFRAARESKPAEGMIALSQRLATEAVKREVQEYAALGISPGLANSGDCSTIARNVVESIRSAGGEAKFAIPRGDTSLAHVWVVAGGKHYDIQHPQGVSDPSQLTFFQDEPDLLTHGWQASHENPIAPKSSATTTSPSDLRREAVKSAIGDTYSRYNGTHLLLQDIAARHKTLAGALAEAERLGLIDTRQRSPQTDVSPLQKDRQGEWVRRVLGQAYGEKEPESEKPKVVRDRVPEGTYGPSKARIRYEDKGEREAAETAAREFFGRTGTPQDFAGAAGAPNDATVSIRVDVGEVLVFLNGTRGDTRYDGTRTLSKNSDGKLTVHNDSFNGKSVGLEMFGRQVEQATRLGIGHIDTVAAGYFEAGSDPKRTYAKENGYVTWPKFGYDGELDKGDVSALPANLKADVEAADGHVRGLMKTAEGQDWWLRNGFSINLRFDLTPGSYSQRTLAGYLEKRGVLK